MAENNITKLKISPENGDSFVLDISNLWMIRSYGYTITIGADSMGTISAGDFGITSQPGYSIAGILTFNLGSTWGLKLEKFTPSTNSTDNVMVIHNDDNSAKTVTVSIKLLWIKSDSKA